MARLRGGNSIAGSRRRRCNVPTSLRSETLNCGGREISDIRRGLSVAKRCARSRDVLKGISAGAGWLCGLPTSIEFQASVYRAERKRNRERERRSRSRKCPPQPSEESTQLLTSIYFLPPSALIYLSSRL